MVINRYRVSIYLLLFIAVVYTTACSPKVVPAKSADASKAIAIKPPHFTTDSFYTAKTDSLLKLVKLQQPVMLADSTGLITTPSEWVGSVNFGVRKANYVIIHYTAQDSVQQTIRTFTLL